MTSTDGDIPPEVRDAIERGVAITEILDSIGNAELASKALSVAIAHMLCFRMKDEEAAHKMMDMIINDIDSAVLMTKQFGCTSWVEGSAH